MRCHLLISSLAFAILGCGPGDAPPAETLPTPPERLERSTPGIDEEPTVGEAPELESPVIETFPEEPVEEGEVVCCETAFVLPDGVREDDEVSAVLVGGEAPLDVEGGLTLTYSDGGWRVTACIPPDYNSGYHYVVSIADENGDVAYESVRTNPNVPSGYSDTGEINLWESATTCDEIDVAVHALAD